MVIHRDQAVYDSRARLRLAQESIERHMVDQPAVPRPPGPRGWELLVCTLIRREPAPEVFARFCRENPGIAHFAAGGEHVYVVSDPDLIVEVFHTRGRDSVKVRVLQGAKAVLGEGLLTAEGDHHMRQRRLIQPAFHRSRIAGYAESMVAEGRAHASGWRDGATFDVAADMSRLTLQIVGRTLFGADLSGDAREVAEALEVVMANATAPLQPFAHFRARFALPPFGRTMAAGDQLDTIVQRMIEEHRAAGDTGDLLSMMIAAQEDGVAMDDAQLRDEAMTLVLAGHETTAMWLTWTWLLLARHPEQAAWLHEELDGLPDRPPQFEDIPGLPRTHAVLAESLRLYPPAWMVGRRLQTDIGHQGWRIPSGSMVLAPPWVMHRHPRYWRYPMAFRPQRWLDAAGRFDEKQPGQPRGAWYPFGWGRRKCIGDQFAWTEAALLLALLARDWQLGLADPGQRVVADGTITLRPRGPLPMVLSRRRPDMHIPSPPRSVHTRAAPGGQVGQSAAQSGA